MPEDDKRRLLEICRRRRRDASSYALEFIADGIARVEREIAQAVASPTQEAVSAHR